MNGILHNCTHKDSDDATFRMSEDQMFIAIFSYIELLFDKVKPKKVFFMAVDGVAPRAKMNQQRSRRFRTALDAEIAVKKAIREGTTLPKEAPFDTNAITPGTEFMTKLSKQLHYFISKKVSEDSRWQNVEVILSGHEVPGEGEHKIMEYIRATKTQSGYNANTRHCLYGLDADLIMLGLLSHDPHFCLLREEVLFGPARKKPKELFHQKFFLLHLSLVREYLELEFEDIKHQFKFAYEFERVLDDFILLCIFVGNDFLPNLPQLHINEGALTVMFNAYKRALPKCTTYLTDSGTINLENLRFLLKELVDFEFKLFEAENDDLLYMDSKATANGRSKSKRSTLEMTPRQKMIFDSVESYLLKVRTDNSQRHMKWELPLFAVQDDLQFIETMAGKLSLDCSVLDMPTGQIVSLRLEDAIDSDDTDEEAEYALQRVLSQYRSAPIQEEITKVTDKEPSGRVLKMFNEWKDKYYKSKLGFSYGDESEVTSLCGNYIQGLQWVLNYYYKGVSSWSWFFKYHYAPRVSDISKGLSADLNFEKGVPFRPFEQLMGVLPDRSSQLIPISYRSLMHDPNSPIIEFYPKEFALDLNGKKQDWEAVVKIPFVDEERLLQAMQPLEKQLTPAERKRNTFGKMIKFSYDPNMNEVYASSLQDVFPDIPENHCHITEYQFPPMAGRQYKSGLGEGVKLGAHALAGFPTLHTIPHTAALTTRHSVNVFQQDSRREAMIVSLDDVFEELTTEQIAAKRLETKVYIGWPYIREAMIIEICDDSFSYSMIHSIGATTTSNIVQSPMTPADVQTFDIRRAAIYTQHAKLGVDIGTVDVLAKVVLLKGMKQLPNGALVKEYDWTPSLRVDYAMQTILTSVVNEDERYKEKPAPPISEQFPVGTRGFYLGEEAYAQPLQVLEIDGQHHADVFVAAAKPEDMTFGTAIAEAEQKKVVYYASIDVCRALHIPSLLLSKITASYSVTSGEQDSSNNIGLNLKFEGKKQKVLGYTRRTATGWEYSDKAKNLIKEYQTKFPDLFEGLKREVHTDRPSISTLLGVPEKVAQKRLDEIKVWLKSAESGRMDRVPLDSEQLLPESVEAIEKHLTECFGNTEPGEPITISHVPQAALLKPSDATHKLGHQRFALGDRIVYVKDSGNVPIASKGTVIGITTADGRRVLDVVFDVTFLGGTDLGGRCSPDRGMTVECSSVVNLTTKQLLCKTQAPYNHSNGRGRGRDVGRGRGHGRGRGRGRGGRGGH
ncbi:XRN 5'-3' exonuclease N-terminus-domain-containing protein, partial [Lipomyces kononenkoae]